MPTEHSEEKDSTGPYISWGATVFRLIDDLWCHIRGSSAKDFYSLIIGNACRKTKVNKFYIFGFVEQNIFQLNVSMSNASVVAVSYAFNNLLEHTFGLGFGKSSVGVTF